MHRPFCRPRRLSNHRGHRGDGGDLAWAIVGPRLQVLESKERCVVQAHRVLLNGLAQRLLEGFLLQLQHNATRLLPLCFSFFCSLSPAMHTHTNMPTHLSKARGIYRGHSVVVLFLIVGNMGSSGSRTSICICALIISGLVP